MIEKMVKLKMQRTLLMSGLLAFMVKNFEDEEVNKFKVALAKKYIDRMSENGGIMMLEDETEAVIYKSILTFMEKESALLSIKNILNKI